MIINFLHHFFFKLCIESLFRTGAWRETPPPFFRFKHRDKVRFFLEKVIHTMHHIFQTFAGKWPWTLMLRDTYFSFKKLLSVFFSESYQGLSFGLVVTDFSGMVILGISNHPAFRAFAYLKHRYAMYKTPTN